MARFVKGPFETIGEVEAAIHSLLQEGYEKSAITVVADKEDDLHALEQQTSVDVQTEEADELIGRDDRPFLENITDAFTGFFFSRGERSHGGAAGNYTDDNDDPHVLLKGYQRDLENGKIVLLVEDRHVQESKFNLDAVDNLESSTPSDTPEIKDADPSVVMEDMEPETDSHPDIDENEDVLEQETTYVPSESMDTFGVQQSERKYHDIPAEVDVTPIPTDESGAQAEEFVNEGEERVIVTPPTEPDTIPTDVNTVDVDEEEKRL